MHVRYSFYRIYISPTFPLTCNLRLLFYPLQKTTNAEIITLDRPLRCAFGCAKCCCYQEATISSGGETLGSIHETCWYCIPTMKILDADGKDLYLVYPPTCCGGICINCCAEGNPCGKGCCKTSHRIYDPEDTNAGSDDPYLGTILKRPKSTLTEIFTDAVVLDVEFPKDATPAQKGILTGLAVFINSVFYEGNDDN